MNIFYFLYNLFWGDFIQIPIGNSRTIGISFLVILLLIAGIYFTIRTKFLPIRMGKEMMKVAIEKKQSSSRNSISGLQALIVSTATRVGMGNLVGVVAAISLGGAGAVFWMWVTALVGASTAFVESTLAQLYQVEDPIYGGYKGGPAYVLHAFAEKRKNRKLKKSVLGILFAISGLICWCGISQVIGNSVSEAMHNAFFISPQVTAMILVIVCAVIVLRKNMTVKVLDAVVPVMAFAYFGVTLWIIICNIQSIPDVVARIFSEAFGLQQAVSGGIGAVIMNGIKRGLFSNEAGSGSAPCASASGEVSHPVKSGLLQSLGVFIDTLVICTCSAMIMLLTPGNITRDLSGMDLLQASMSFHLGEGGVIFIAITLLLFSCSTFIGVLYYARSNVSYIFGDNWWSQTCYKLIALVMLYVGCLTAYQFVWDLGDFGIALMTILNMIALFPMSKEALDSLKDYEDHYM